MKYDNDRKIYILGGVQIDTAFTNQELSLVARCTSNCRYANTDSASGVDFEGNVSGFCTKGRKPRLITYGGNCSADNPLTN